MLKSNAVTAIAGFYLMFVAPAGVPSLTDRAAQARRIMDAGCASNKAVRLTTLNTAGKDRVLRHVALSAALGTMGTNIADAPGYMNGFGGTEAYRISNARSI
jgi:hypothetical protein